MTRARPIHASIGAALAALLPFAGQASEIGPEALDTLPPADIVILGEVHDNPVHHAHQARAIAALSPAALVFEMILPEQAARITDTLRDDPAALAAVLDWQARGWPDFSMYHPLFTAAPQAAIFGGDVPRDDVRRAVSEGAAAVFGEGAGALGLTTPLPPDEQAAREARQAAAHCDMLPDHLLPGMVEAQRLRDAALAQAALAALAETGGPVAVITGTGHAHLDWGMPANLRAAAPGVRVLSVGQYEIPADGALPHDLWLITDATPRPDPCAAFRQGTVVPPPSSP
jgi:uncharacterized iron-regulated protein